jgi:hypothetical protein
MACYGDSFTVLHVDNVPTSQGTPPRPVTGMALLFYVDNVRSPQQTPPWPVTGIALLFKGG